MMMKTLFISSILVSASLPAYAFHCPMDMKKIDAALAQATNLTPQQLAEVRELRAQGEAYHRAGDHRQSVKVLARAKRTLHIQ